MELIYLIVSSARNIKFQSTNIKKKQVNK
jgi:hypothetical protein